MKTARKEVSMTIKEILQGQNGVSLHGQVKKRIVLLGVTTPHTSCHL